MNSRTNTFGNQCDLVSFGFTQIDQYQCLLFIYADRTMRLAFKTALLDQPACRDLHLPLSCRIGRHVRILPLQLFVMDNRNNRVHKETSGISQLIGIRQFLTTDRDHSIPHSLQRYLWIFSQFLFQIAVIDRKPRLFAQTYIYISNNVRVVMLILEETIPITIKTFFICKHTFLERKLVICLHRLEHILEYRMPRYSGQRLLRLRPECRTDFLSLPNLWRRHKRLHRPTSRQLRCEAIPNRLSLSQQRYLLSANAR